MDDPYSILNVYSDCTYEEAKAAYRKAALLHHPDRQPLSRKSEAERRFRILSNAFQQVCHELGHPIEPPEIVPSVQPILTTSNTSPSALLKPSSVTSSKLNHSNLSKLPVLNKSARLNDDRSHPSIPDELTNRRSLRLPREELIRNREMDELEQQSPYDDNDALDRPVYVNTQLPKTAYTQDNQPTFQRVSNRQYTQDPPLHRGYREEGGGNRRNDDRSVPIEDTRHDQYPASRRSISSQYPASRRSSFSQSNGPDYNGPRRRELVENPSNSRSYNQDRSRPNDLYDLKPMSNRNNGFNGTDEWDNAFGLPVDDFFGNRSSDPFNTSNNKMSDLSLGFDKLLSNAMTGLNIGGPNPNTLDNIGTNPDCMMRVRQSKTVMGQNLDGSWSGQKLDKQMRVANGRMEINENGQEIKIGGRNHGHGQSARHHPNGRGHGEDWDPPPAYEGDDDEFAHDERPRHHPDDYHPHPSRRSAQRTVSDQYDHRHDSRNRADQNGSGLAPTRSRPNPPRGYVDDAPRGYADDGTRGYIDDGRDYLDDPPQRGYGDDGPSSSYHGGGSGGGRVSRTHSMSQARPQYHPETRSVVRRADGPVVRR